MTTRRILISAAILTLCASVAVAQLPVRTVSGLPTALCTSGELEDHLFAVSDGDSAGDCSTGGGSTLVICACDGGTLRAANSPDLSAYAPLAGADFTGPVSVTTSPSNSWSVNDAEFEAWAHLAVDEDTITGTVSCLFEDDGGPDGECKMQATNSDGFGASVSMYPGSVSVQASTVSSSAFASIDGNAGIMSFTATNSIGIQGCDNWGPRANYSTISGAAECDTFFDTTLHIPCFYNGSAWVSALDGSTACTAS